MLILKVWGNGNSPSQNNKIPDESWADFAPDLSEFFDNDNIQNSEKSISTPDDFEIDWDSVYMRDDWVHTAEPNRQNINHEPLRAPIYDKPALYENSVTTAPPRKKEIEQDYRKPKQEKIKKKRKQKTKTKTVTKTVYVENGNNPPKKKHRIRNLIIFLIIMGGLYSVAVFSNIPFIAKWRTIYIETAMSTMNHQWLATAFIPKFVIDNVVNGREELEEQQDGLSSDWGGIGTIFDKNNTSPWKKLEKKFFSEYSEIDEKSFSSYMSKNENEAIDKNGYLMIDKAGLKDAETGIKTIHNDDVIAVDTENGITIAKITGEGYVGRLAIVKDPAKVGLALSSGYGSAGSFATDIAEKKNAVLAINASGFFDPDGKGNGGVAHGVVISNGKKYNDSVGGTYKTIALDKKDRLNIGQYKDVSGFRDAVEFKPALIIDGEKVVSGSAGWGVQPRTAIGQTENGELLMLVIDGRAPGYSIGATVGQCAEILAKYGAVQACNLDGGSSSVMVYNGREITKPSAANKEKGRHIPDAFVVYKK